MMRYEVCVRVYVRSVCVRTYVCVCVFMCMCGSVDEVLVCMWLCKYYVRMYVYNCTVCVHVCRVQVCVCVNMCVSTVT